MKDDVDVALADPSSLVGGEGADDFSIRFRHHGTVTTLTCSGELEGGSVERFDQALDMVLETDPRELSIDMRRVHTMTFEALDSLLRVARVCDASGTKLRVEPGPVVADFLKGCWAPLLAL